MDQDVLRERRLSQTLRVAVVQGRFGYLKIAFDDVVNKVTFELKHRRRGQQHLVFLQIAVVVNQVNFLPSREQRFQEQEAGVLGGADVAGQTVAAAQID